MQKQLIYTTTLDLLNAPKNIPSSQFMKVYNAIYLECTNNQPVYEIKGRVVYEYLTEIANEFTSRLNPFESVSEIFLLLNKYDLSINLIRILYSYLERFFIKVSIDKRDRCVMDIKTLFYTHLYQNYLEKRENHLFDLLIFEIESLKSSDKSKILRLRKTIEHTKNILAANERELSFKALIKKYFSFFASKIKSESNLRVQCELLHNRIRITSKLFESYYIMSIRRNFIKILSKRKEEVLVLIIEEMKMNKCVKFLFTVIETLEIKEKFYNSFRDFISFMLPKTSEINFESVIDMYLFLKERISKDFNDDKILIQIINERNYMNDLNELSIFIINKLNTGILGLSDKKRITALIDFINLMDYNKLNEDKLTHDMENRLLFHKHGTNLEIQVSKCIDKKKYLNFYSKIRRCIRDIQQLNYTFTFEDNKLVELPTGQEIEDDTIYVDFKMLTSGFWDIQTKRYKENPELEYYRKHIIGYLDNKLVDRVVTFNYDISPILIEFNGCRIKLSTSAYLILDVVSQNDGISLETINQSLQQECEDHLQILVKSEILITTEGMYFVNRNFNNKKVDIFERNIKRPEDYILVPTQTINYLFSIEAQIVRLLKKFREYDKNELFRSIECMDIELFDKAVDNLLKKEFLGVNHCLLFYIP